jgi:hypothetical protein
MPDVVFLTASVNGVLFKACYDPIWIFSCCGPVSVYALFHPGDPFVAHLVHVGVSSGLLVRTVCCPWSSFWGEDEYDVILRDV